MEAAVVALTYSTALYEAAKELGKQEQFLTEVSQLAVLVKTYEDFAKFLNSPAIIEKAKKEAVKKIMQDRFSQEMINFVYVLIDKMRTAEIPAIARQYLKLYDKESGVAAGKIFSVVKLTPEQLHKFEAEMSRLLRKHIKLENRLDQTLIGGVKIQVDGKMIDRSYRADLECLRRELKNQ